MEIQLCVFCQCYMEMTNVSGVNLLISSFQYILQKYKNKYFTSFLCFYFHMVIFTFISCTFIILASSQLLRSQSFWCLIVLICLEPWAKSYWHSSCPNLSLKIPCRLVLAFFFFCINTSHHWKMIEKLSYNLVIIQKDVEKGLEAKF